MHAKTGFDALSNWSKGGTNYCNFLDNGESLKNDCTYDTVILDTVILRRANLRILGGRISVRFTLFALR